ncbi:MAG: hypothetical protein VXW65_01020 [Pseudomonadota bacterium]|nr:hypothetical protein [Pseudomonadota bacterium]
MQAYTQQQMAMSHSTRSALQQAKRAYGVCNVVDEQGREVQITEHMIQTACQALRQRCHLPKQM